MKAYLIKFCIGDCKRLYSAHVQGEHLANAVKRLRQKYIYWDLTIVRYEVVKTYQCHALGRTRGSLGVFYWSWVRVMARNPREAAQRLYRVHEVCMFNGEIEEII